MALSPPAEAVVAFLFLLAFVFSARLVSGGFAAMTENWVFTVAGLVVGFLVGMTGVGGGSLMTPLLILLCGVKPQTAVGTDLIYAALTKMAGTAMNRHMGAVDWKIVLRLLVGSLPGAALSLLYLHHMGASPEGAHVIRVVLGVCLLLTAPAVFMRGLIRKWVESRPAPAPQAVGYLTVLLGFALGVMVTLSSVGAGAVGMAILVMLYPSVPTRVLVATDIAHAVPLALVAGGGHWFQGAIDTSMLLWLLSGSIPGILLGTLCAGRFPEALQRSVLGGILLIVGLRMI